ncbi:MAG: 1,4-dihydroxy-2-naphthoate octaprenyltransferase [Anaerolineaceae bacterium]|nr:MAG: 1,4-dihydroxy-2-naphthoate octaprenyltransferase [Anaerolineaceae bacterium]
MADPKISLASFASIFLGACAAASDGTLHFGWLAATLIGIFAIEIAKNASGEIFDWNSGNDQAVMPEDRSPFSGGKRVLVDKLLTKRQTAGIALAGYAIGGITGLIILLEREPSVLWLGIIGIALAFFYHAPPLKLSYRGMGELAVAASYGPLIGTGTYLVQRGTVSSAIISVAALLGVFIAAFLIINEFPDFHADQAAGKRTLVVLLGRKPASRLFVAIITVAFLLIALLPPLLQFSPAPWLGLIAVVPAFSASKRLLANPETTAQIIPAQANALLTFVLFALGSGVEFLLS